jgi:hypothetical protein
MAFSQTFVFGMADMEILQKAVNAEAGTSDSMPS